jgi:p24 family protein alpha
MRSWIALLLCALSILQVSQAVSRASKGGNNIQRTDTGSLLHAQLYFYIDQHENKCFIEELPNDTVVVGHYMAEEWDSDQGKFLMQDDLGIKVNIRVRSAFGRFPSSYGSSYSISSQEMPTDHVITSSRGPSEGKFAFTAHESGDHEICLMTDYGDSTRRHHGQIRMHLDIVIGDSKPDSSGRNKEHITDLAQRVRDLNAKVRDIRKEQQFQREREAEFRDLSEKTNTRAIYWSAIQMVVLFGTCVWQLRHLRVFFEDKKLR